MECGLGNMKNYGYKSVSLYPLSQLALILLIPTGVKYHNQTGGHSCCQREAEGLLVFVDNGRLYDSLVKYAEEDKGGWWTESDLSDADYLDMLFENSGDSYLKINRERIPESHEAWIYVNIDCNYEYPTYGGFSSKHGILTWDNSD